MSPSPLPMSDHPPTLSIRNEHAILPRAVSSAAVLTQNPFLVRRHRAGTQFLPLVDGFLVGETAMTGRPTPIPGLKFAGSGLCRQHPSCVRQARARARPLLWCRHLHALQ
jgi:hypothetical protein